MMQSMNMVGLVRFSVLTPTYYSERFANLKQTARHLFNPDRMELRFSVFENLCLPSLVRQSDPNFVPGGADRQGNARALPQSVG